MRGRTYFIDGCNKRNCRSLEEKEREREREREREGALGEISMLVSACRKIVSATSRGGLCGFLFALREYLCDRFYSSFRPLLPAARRFFLFFRCPPIHRLRSLSLSLSPLLRPPVP